MANNRVIQPTTTVTIQHDAVKVLKSIIGEHLKNIGNVPLFIADDFVCQFLDITNYTNINLLKSLLTKSKINHLSFNHNDFKTIESQMVQFIKEELYIEQIKDNFVTYKNANTQGIDRFIKQLISPTTPIQVNHVGGSQLSSNAKRAQKRARVSKPKSQRKQAKTTTAAVAADFNQADVLHQWLFEDMAHSPSTVLLSPEIQQTALALASPTESTTTTSTTDSIHSVAESTQSTLAPTLDSFSAMHALLTQPSSTQTGDLTPIIDELQQLVAPVASETKSQKSSRQRKEAAAHQLSEKIIAIGNTYFLFVISPPKNVLKSIADLFMEESYINPEALEEKLKNTTVDRRLFRSITKETLVSIIKPKIMDYVKNVLGIQGFIAAGGLYNVNYARANNASNIEKFRLFSINQPGSTSSHPQSSIPSLNRSGDNNNSVS